MRCPPAGSAVRALFRGDRLDLQQPFAVDGFSDHYRGRGLASPEHLATNRPVGHDLTSIGQERIDLDQMLDAEAGGDEHRDDVAPGLLALRLETFGHAAIRFFRYLAADEQ